MSKASIEIGGIRIGNQSQENPQSQIQSRERTSPGLPFNALILGAFSGNVSADSITEKKPASLKPKIIDRDNFDDILSSIKPTLTLCPTGDQSHSITLSFTELEDFEPDHLFESLNIFSELRTLRRKLANNATFEATAKEMNAWSAATSEPNSNEMSTERSTKSSTQNKSPEPAYEMESDGDFLDTLLAETTHRQEENIAHAGENLAQTLIQQVVEPYIIPGTHPHQAELLANVDDSISGLMNTLLHHPDFQALESSWRSLYSSVKKIRTDSKLKLFITDIDKRTLTQDSEGDDLSTTKAYKSLIEPYTDIPGSIPWSVIVGDYYFGDSSDDILLLERLGLLAQHSNATFIAGAKSELVNCEDIGESPEVDHWNADRKEKYIQAWAFLRDLPQSANLALTFPRILARLPYGEKTKSIDGFSFEEMKGSEHNNYLWGNGAYAILILLAEAFEVDGWDFYPGKNNEINNIPTHSYEENGDLELKPCAEIYLTERGGERILENGLLPIWSILRSDSVRIGPFSSLHSSNQRISGKWNA